MTCISCIPVGLPIRTEFHFRGCFRLGEQAQPARQHAFCGSLSCLPNLHARHGVLQLNVADLRSNTANGGQKGPSGEPTCPATRNHDLVQPNLGSCRTCYPLVSGSRNIADHRFCSSSSVVSSTRVATVHTCPCGSASHPIRSPQS